MRAVVPLDAFRAGELGDRCVSTGVPTTDRAVVRARYLPRWPLLALVAAPWGIPIALGLPLLIGRRAMGVVPCSREAAGVVRRRRHIGWALTILVVVIGAVGAWWTSRHVPTGMTVVWLIAIVGAVALTLRAALKPAGSILARLDRTGRTVILDGVSPAFIASQSELSRLGS
jgi:hypothetical protein